jgi:hypothetical protein
MVRLFPEMFFRLCQEARVQPEHRVSSLLAQTVGFGLTELKHGPFPQQLRESKRITRLQRMLVRRLASPTRHGRH